MQGPFHEILTETFRRNDWILIYPEQEMWFNYTKPRPPKRGAFLFAAEHGVPVIPLFISMETLGKRDNKEFMKVRQTDWVLDPIYPDKNLSARENSKRMMELDYEQKKAAYEKAYGKPLDYTFSLSDIAGWNPL